MPEKNLKGTGKTGKSKENVEIVEVGGELEKKVSTIKKTTNKNALELIEKNNEIDLLRKKVEELEKENKEIKEENTNLTNILENNIHVEVSNNLHKIKNILIGIQFEAIEDFITDELGVDLKSEDNELLLKLLTKGQKTIELIKTKINDHNSVLITDPSKYIMRYSYSSFFKEVGKVIEIHNLNEGKKYIQNYSTIDMNGNIIDKKNILKFDTGVINTIISDLLKNACEACNYDEDIYIDGIYDKRNGNYTLSIINKGEMSEKIIENFGTYGLTSGKENGTGIGNFSIKQHIEALKGHLHTPEIIEKELNGIKTKYTKMSFTIPVLTN